jgi:hypothetical protein
MMQLQSSSLKMQDMDYAELTFAALVATAMASVFYGGMVAAGRENVTSLDIDRVTLAAVITFVSMMVAQHPEWLS